MTVREMLGKMDSRELSEWMAFFEIESRKSKGETIDLTVEDKIKTQLGKFRG